MKTNKLALLPPLSTDIKWILNPKNVQWCVKNTIALHTAYNCITSYFHQCALMLYLVCLYKHFKAQCYPHFVTFSLNLSNLKYRFNTYNGPDLDYGGHCTLSQMWEYLARQTLCPSASFRDEWTYVFSFSVDRAPIGSVEGKPPPTPQLSMGRQRKDITPPALFKVV